MEQDRTAFLKPSSFESLFNRVFGLLVGLGIGLKHNYLLQVRGRKSGKVYSTPVDVLDDSGRLFLVCPRGRAQWVLNAEASGHVTLKHGASIREFALRAVVGFGESPDSQKLSRPLQAHRAALLSCPCRLPARGFLSLPRAISSVRIDTTAPRDARLNPTRVIH
jgi:deazaflavin-dependent oxidoreductase (nitroreductase family)